MLRCVLLFLLCAAAAACGRTDSSAPTPERADTRVRELADAYVSAFFDQFPEQATYYGVPGRRHDRLTDNSLAALAAWQAREDRWLADVEGDRPGRRSSRGRCARTYAILREALESSAASRVCRNELWNVSQMTGWQVNLRLPRHDSARRQRPGAPGRAGALGLAAEVPRHRDRQPARRDEARLHRAQAHRPHRHRPGAARWRRSPAGRLAVLRRRATATRRRSSRRRSPRLSTQQIVPAARRYADFLEQEYLPAAREAIAGHGQPGRRRRATTPASGRSARCRSRQERCTTPACARSRASTPR